MTQQYYTERLLPLYIKEIQRQRIYYNRDGILQEDNYPLHGTRSQDGKARRLKESNWINILLHPAQSPDLNPIEGI
ncbi:hypothetical protein AOQ84DRAFT_353389 [Glonium stellatum]|uniref:Tc1-like transposase DDE domain-containing protein n=1 Tax=Glonium stellatum TaxID=574774 RepID=A0A8E2JV70_9PEZI|nr:hypothetical protein AOQ84DRAFT_353389 [Glonium stellatum]